MVSRVAGTDVEEARPSTQDTDTFELPETPDSLVLGAMEEAMRTALPARDDDEVEQEDLAPEDEEDVEEDEDAEPDAGLEPLEDQDEAEQGEPQGKSVEEWVEVLSKDGVQRFSEIPRKALKDVLPKYVEQAKRQVAEDVGLVARAQLEAQLQWVKWTMNVDRTFEDDPDAKLAWLESGTQEVQQYQQWKAIIDREPTPENRAQSEQATNIRQSMARQVQRLDDYPELKEELARRGNATPYPLNFDGLGRLTDDVMELLKQGVEQSVSKRKEPAKEKAKARVASAQNRAQVPRPDVSRGRTAARNGTDISNNNDPDELIALGISQTLRNLKR